jgi:hypothetical protein
VNDFLKRIPLFADLSTPDLQALSQVIEELRLPSGRELFAEGSCGDCAYLIKEGEIHIFKAVGAGEVLLAVRRVGEVLGEMALLETAPRMASARAATDSVLLVIGQQVKADCSTRGEYRMITTETITRPTSLTEWFERVQQTWFPLMAESTQHGLSYQAQPTDLFISPFTKCGTTWLQQIVHGLRTRGDMDFDDISRVVPWLETAQGLGLDLQAPQRGSFRVFKCHLSWDAIPKGGRYIVSFRDPKDALVSFYHFFNGWQWEAGSVSIAEFANTFYMANQGDGWDGSYWAHLVSWWEQRHHPQVLLLCYEAMKADLPGTVQTIADFLAVELDEQLLELAVKQASLDFMLAHKEKFSDPLIQEVHGKIGFLPPSSASAKVRKGRVGDHRTELSADISAKLDAIWREEVEARVGLSSYQALREALVLHIHPPS